MYLLSIFHEKTGEGSKNGSSESKKEKKMVAYIVVTVYLLAEIPALFKENLLFCYETMGVEILPWYPLLVLSDVVSLILVGIYFLGKSWLMLVLFLDLPKIAVICLIGSFWYWVGVKWIVFYLFIAFQVILSMNYINNLIFLILLFTMIGLTLWIGYLLDFISFILLSLYVGGVLILFLTVIKLLGVEKRDLISTSIPALIFWSCIVIIAIGALSSAIELLEEIYQR